MKQWRIVNYFATVMDRITEILEQQVKLKKLLWFLHFHCYPLNHIDHHILLSASSVSEVTKSLVPDYINYKNTGLLEAIIERLSLLKQEIAQREA